MATILAVAYVYSFTNDARAILVLDLVISGVGLAGVFGFAYRRRLLRPRLWAIWAVLLPLWDVAFNLVLYVPAGQRESAISMAAGLLILVPEYIAVFRYGYRSSDIWTSPESPDPQAQRIG